LVKFSNFLLVCGVFLGCIKFLSFDLYIEYLVKMNDCTIFNLNQIKKFLFLSMALKAKDDETLQNINSEGVDPIAQADSLINTPVDLSLYNVIKKIQMDSLNDLINLFNANKNSTDNGEIPTIVYGKAVSIDAPNLLEACGYDMQITDVIYRISPTTNSVFIEQLNIEIDKLTEKYQGKLTKNNHGDMVCNPVAGGGTAAYTPVNKGDANLPIATNATRVDHTTTVPALAFMSEGTEGAAKVQDTFQQSVRDNIFRSMVPQAGLTVTTCVYGFLGSGCACPPPLYCVYPFISQVGCIVVSLLAIKCLDINYGTVANVDGVPLAVARYDTLTAPTGQDMEGRGGRITHKKRRFHKKTISKKYKKRRSIKRKRHYKKM
jgi:hypothetical protein